jgi:cell division protein ZapA
MIWCRKKKKCGEIKHKFLTWRITMAGQESRVEVEIFGEYYTLKGDSSPEELVKLAHYVNRKMKVLSGRNSRLSRTQTAVLAALNIAEEFMRLREEYDNLVRIIEPPEEHNKKNS